MRIEGESTPPACATYRFGEGRVRRYRGQENFTENNAIFLISVYLCDFSVELCEMFFNVKHLVTDVAGKTIGERYRLSTLNQMKRKDL